MDPDQSGHPVGPDLGPNCLEKLSADDKAAASKERVNKEVNLNSNSYSCFRDLIFHAHAYLRPGAYRDSFFTHTRLGFLVFYPCEIILSHKYQTVGEIKNNSCMLVTRRSLKSL